MKNASENTEIIPLPSLLGDTTRLLWRRFDQEARRSGSTRAQWHAIFKIDRQEGLRQAELAELLEIEPITLTRMLDRMEEGGWVERRRDPDDRRARRLFLTDKAREAVVDMRHQAQLISEEALDGLSVAEIDMLLSLLARVRDNIARTLAGAGEGK